MSRRGAGGGAAWLLDGALASDAAADSVVDGGGAGDGSGSGDATPTVGCKALGPAEANLKAVS